MYGVRRDKSMPPEVRAGVTPRTQADNPVGQWNTYEVTTKEVVLPGVKIPGLPSSGPIGLQHHGSMGKDGKWTGPPSLIQFKNIFIKTDA
jgi:hypothetical protein